MADGALFSSVHRCVASLSHLPARSLKRPLTTNLDVKLFPSGPAILVSEGFGQPLGVTSRMDDRAFQIREDLYKPVRAISHCTVKTKKLIRARRRNSLIGTISTRMYRMLHWSRDSFHYTRELRKGTPTQEPRWPLLLHIYLGGLHGQPRQLCSLSVAAELARS